MGGFANLSALSQFNRPVATPGMRQFFPGPTLQQPNQPTASPMPWQTGWAAAGQQPNQPVGQPGQQQFPGGGQWPGYTGMNPMILQRLAALSGMGGGMNSTY